MRRKNIASAKIIEKLENYRISVKRNHKVPLLAERFYKNRDRGFVNKILDSDNAENL